MNVDTIQPGTKDDDVQIMYNILMKLKRESDAVGLKEAKIKFSAPYVKLNRVITEAQEAQQEMLADLDMEPVKNYEEYRKTFTGALAKRGLTHFREWQARLRKVKRVNNQALMNALDGDIDLFMKLANVTQVALKEHAKEHGSKNALMECVEEFEQIVDFEFQDTPMRQ